MHLRVINRPKSVFCRGKKGGIFSFWMSQRDFILKWKISLQIEPFFWFMTSRCFKKKNVPCHDNSFPFSFFFCTDGCMIRGFTVGTVIIINHLCYVCIYVFDGNGYFYSNNNSNFSSNENTYRILVCCCTLNNINMGLFAICSVKNRWIAFSVSVEKRRRKFAAGFFVVGHNVHLKVNIWAHNFWHSRTHGSTIWIHFFSLLLHAQLLIED